MTKDFNVEALRQIILGEGLLVEIAEKNIAWAKHYCPVKTGELQDSIHYVVDDEEMAVIVGSDNPYCKFIEYGTGPMEAAHGAHDPKHPVTDWESKRKTGKNMYAQMPFLRPGAFVTQAEMKDMIPKTINMEVKIVVR